MADVARMKVAGGVEGGGCSDEVVEVAGDDLGTSGEDLW